MIPRRESRAIQVGDVTVGGGSPITVQSMTTCKTHEVQSTLNEIKRLADAGADGVIIGSHLVRMIEENLQDKPKMLNEISTFLSRH